MLSAAERETKSDRKRTKLQSLPHRYTSKYTLGTELHTGRPHRGRERESVCVSVCERVREMELAEWRRELKSRGSFMCSEAQLVVVCVRKERE